MTDLMLYLRAHCDAAASETFHFRSVNSFGPPATFKSRETKRCEPGQNEMSREAEHATPFARR